MKRTTLGGACHLWIGACLIISGASFSQAAIEAPDLSIREALDLANQYSPDLKAARSREEQARSQIGISQSTYLPSVYLDAVDSTGFAGSTGELGVLGISGSPFRSGFSVSASLTQDIFDFGRTYYRVKMSRSALQAEEQRSEVKKYDIEAETLRAYFDCSLNRTQEESWRGLTQEAGLISREVDRFVNTGQRSIVDRYLAKAQEEQAQTSEADFLARGQASQRRIRVLTGNQSDFSCPALSKISLEGVLKTSAGSVNPIIAQARFEADQAQASLDQARSEHLPRLLGIASAGYLQDAHVLNTQDYSLGIALEFPLFEGFKVKKEVERNSALLEEKTDLVAARQQALDDMNQQFEEKIQSASVRIEHLTREYQLAVRAFDVAKKRYFGLQGTLVDVRDALSNLGRVTSDLNLAQSNFLESRSLQSILNGAR